ncbi:MAG: SDR family oxidoreductase [Candidatus Malihini olakiniferum]
MYCTAKSRVIRFTKSLALILTRKRITVNVISPAYIETDMVIENKLINNISIRRRLKLKAIAKVLQLLAKEAL